MGEFTRSEEALVALASMPAGRATPVQAVKMLFLMEKKASEALGGAKYHFVPYDYGPFDQSVYTELDGLRNAGLIEVIEGRPRLYHLTESGRQTASAAVGRLDPHVAEYFSKLGRWIASLSFSQLVSAIYREYPEMRANSIFRG